MAERKTAKATKHEIIEVDQAQKGGDKSMAVYQDSAERLMVQAIDKNVPVETMEKLMAMRRELKAEWAKEQYNIAMAKFQAECPVIEKKKTARDEELKKDLYKYAPLDSIVEQTQELIAKHGFSYTFRTETTPTSVKVTCIVMHKAGHSEESTMETSLATKTRIMSGPQQIASTVTFNKRYAFCNVFGIMTGDEDVDAAKKIVEPDVVKPTPKKPQPIKNGTLVQIRNMVEVQKVDAEKLKSGLVKVTGKETLETLTEDEGQKILAMFQKKLEGEMKTAKADVDAAMPPIANDTIQKRAMECKTQEEASQIAADMKKLELSDIKRTALTNILKTKGFTV